MKKKNVKIDSLKFKKPLTQQEKEEFARLYTPLVYKIALQNKDKSPLEYSDLLGFGFEGLADAMNTYNPSMGQTFMQYAAYRIYYFIKNGSYEEGHIVKFSAYLQDQAKKNGLPTFISQSIESTFDEDGECTLNLPQLKEDPKYMDIEQALEKIQNFVKHNFNKKYVDVFFKTFGLAGKDEVSRVKIAKQYKVTSASITYINNRIINAIKANDDLREELETLL